MSKVIAGNRVSLAQQVARAVQQRISTGQYTPGDRLPPVRMLSREFGVSLNVIQRAVMELQRDGLVATHVGRGMVVLDEAGAGKAAILFGAIHPYTREQMFGSFLAGYIHEALAKHSNFAVVLSSQDDASAEKHLAKHLVANGARGLIVWPTTDDPNGEFFTELSREIPVVLVDRLLPDADLPTVLLDYTACGRDIAQTLLEQMGSKRLLVVMDNLRISSYEDITAGIESAARDLGRGRDVTFVQLPISRRIVRNIGNEDYSDVPEYAQYVERILKEGHYDALFCTQDEFLDYVVAQTPLAEACKNVRVATLRSDAPSERSMMYARLEVLEWAARTGEMLIKAAELAQEWVFTRRNPGGVTRMKLNKK
ncbi:MAG: GntR family transcriptional regulator [Phycisphaerae bacterium]|nr:GntR family transcriptional regulator [Phycisphaerae bacterium]